MDELLTIISTTVASVVEPLLDRYPARRTPAASAGLSHMASVQYPALGSALADNPVGALALPMNELPHSQRHLQRHQDHAREQEQHQQGQQQHHHHGQQQQQYQHYQTTTTATTTTAAAATMVHHGSRRPVSGSGGHRRMGRRDGGGGHDVVTDAYAYDHDNGEDEEGHDDRDDELLPAAAPYEPGRSCVDLLLRLLGGCGATEKRINALPVVALHVDAYGEVADDSILFNQDTCSICLDGYDVCNTVRVLGCHHVYHAMCIDVWLRRRPTCPVRCCFLLICSSFFMLLFSQVFIDSF
jgi:Ring finger domain